MLEKMLSEYREKFKKPYPLFISGDKTEKEIIEEIKRCINKGEEAKETDYVKGVDY